MKRAMLHELVQRFFPVVDFTQMDAAEPQQVENNATSHMVSLENSMTAQEKEASFGKFMCGMKA